MKTRVFLNLILFSLGLGLMPTFAQTYDGYTLYTKMGNTNTYLIDMSGSIYHTWSSSVASGYSCYLLPNHHLLRSGQYSGNQLNGAAMCGMVQNYDWNGTLTWQYIYSSSTYCSHHDIHYMPNGNVLLIAYEVKTPAQATAAGCSQSITLWPDAIIEVQPSGSSGGTIVWEWHAWDHLVQQYDATKANYGVVANHPELLNINYNTTKEWMHTNGLDYNPVLDQIVFSCHNLNEIYVIDHSTTTVQAATHSGGNSGKGGDILYRWGNPAAYNQGTTANRVFNVVHDAHWIQQGLPWANRLVAFNNMGATGNHSCIDVITPPYNGYNYTYTSGAYSPSTYQWRHTCLADASNQSSSQKLPNGNLLICISSSGYIYEIDSNQVLKWSKTVGGTVCKAYRYSPCYVNGGLSVTATAAPTTLCSGGSTQLNATATGGGTTTTYSWSSIPPGFTSTLQNPTVSPTATTIYIATATSDGCSGSDSITVTVQNQPSVVATANPGVLCAGYPTQLTATPTGTVSYTFVWSSVPAGFSSNLQNPTAYPTVNTSYFVTISGSGCSASDSVDVTMGTPPAVTAGATPEALCAGGTVQLSASAIGPMNYTYSWTSLPPGFTSNLQNPLVVPVVSTIYVAFASANGCSSSDSIAVTAYPIPVKPTIILVGDTLLSSASSGNQWYLDGSVIQGATQTYYVPTQPGSYTVQVTDQNQCTSAMSDAYMVVGVEDLTLVQEVVCYPNPTTSLVYLKLKSEGDNCPSIQVYNMMGVHLLTTTSNVIDFSPYIPGPYLILLTFDNATVVKKTILKTK